MDVPIRSSLLCAICLTVGTAVAGASQASAPPVLSGTLRDHVKNERFQVVTAIRGLPLGVREELQTLFGGQTLDIADAGAEFQGSGRVVNLKLALRRLVAAGCSYDHCLVHYERGGRPHTWLVAIFHWTPSATRLEWAGEARGRLATIDDVRNAVLTGAVKRPVKVW
jgi:hypothetical protein